MNGGVDTRTDGGGGGDHCISIISGSSFLVVHHCSSFVVLVLSLLLPEVTAIQTDCREEQANWVACLNALGERWQDSCNLKKALFDACVTRLAQDSEVKSVPGSSTACARV